MIGWVIFGGCVAGFWVSNAIIATLHPRGSFGRVASNFLSFIVWLCLGVALGLIAAAPRL